MTVWQRITRFAVIGLAVGALTACTCQVGANTTGSDGAPIQDTSGYASWSHNYQYSYLIGGNYHSRAGSVKYNHQRPVKVRWHRVVHPLGQCPWINPVCTMVNAANPDDRVGGITLDTNGDGYIAGAPDWYPAGGNCGFTDAATSEYGPHLPYSALYLDTPTCKTPEGTLFTSCITSASSVTWGVSSTQFPNDPVSAWRHLPFETMQQLVNSLESADVTHEMVAGAPMPVARFQVTKVKIGGDSYRPINVYLKLYNWGAMIGELDKMAGERLLAGWAANKIETLLERGATSIRMEVELNGSVTLTRDALPPNMDVTQPSFSTVESWRNFATSHLRQD